MVLVMSSIRLYILTVPFKAHFDDLFVCLFVVWVLTIWLAVNFHSTHSGGRDGGSFFLLLFLC